MACFKIPSLVYIFVAMLLWAIPFTGAGSLIPQILTELCDGDISKASRLTGYLTAANSLLSFMMSPALGVLSDRFGRKPIFILSLLGSTMDFCGFAFSNNVWVLFVTHTLAGAVSCTFTLVYCMLADVSSPTNRSRNFGIVGVATGLGIVGGQLTAGYLATKISLRFPFYLAAGAALVDVVYCIFILPETKPKEKIPWNPKRLNPFKSLGLLLHSKLALGLSCIYSFMFLAEDGIIDTFVLFFKFKYSFNPFQISTYMAVLGVTFALANGLFIRLAVRVFKDRGTIIFGLIVDVLSVPIFGLIPTSMPWLLYPLFCFRSLALVVMPSFQAMICNQYPKEVQGEINGLVGGLKTFTAFIGPLIFNNLFGYYIKPTAWPFPLPAIVYYVASIDFAICLVAVLILFYAIPISKTHVGIIIEERHSIINGEPELPAGASEDFYGEISDPENYDETKESLLPSRSSTSLADIE